MPAPRASIVVPTRGRAASLSRALAAIAPQAAEADAQVIVVEDGGTAARAVAEHHGARWVGLERPRGPNAARNAGIAASATPLIVLGEDDVEPRDGWLRALLDAAAAHPDVGVFGGPIRGR